MEAKDTILAEEQWREIFDKEIRLNTAYHACRKCIKAQAEISFKAGMVERQKETEKRIKDLQETCSQWERLSADSRKVGIREVVEWVKKEIIIVASDGVLFIRHDQTLVKQKWQAKLKEWQV